MKIQQRAMATMAGIMAVVGCRPGDILDVPPPSGEFTGGAVQGATGELQAFTGAKSQLFGFLGGSGYLIEMSELLSDEFTWSVQNALGGGNVYEEASVDARSMAATSANNVGESFVDQAIGYLISSHSSLVLAQAGLEQYAETSNPETVGEAFALIGYTELFLAEDYCAGITLSQALPLSGWSYGHPLTTDSLYQLAAAHFDSALAHASNNDTVTSLAKVGLARTLLDQGHIAQAATAASGVPVAFEYDIELLPGNGPCCYYTGSNLYQPLITNSCQQFNVSDREGTNGLPFVSAQDPRLVLDSSLQETYDGCVGGPPDSVAYYPVKFGLPQTTGLIPLATGIEAQLIQAEAALANNSPGWLDTLNALRNSGCRHVEASDTSCVYGTGQVSGQPYGLQSLTDPGTNSARVAMLFRERAFWLFGTGIRLGDMRRQIRQYGQWYSANNVFPVGTYSPISPNLAFPTYGTDVALILPTKLSGVTTANPYYKGCIAPTTQA